MCVRACVNVCVRAFIHTIAFTHSNAHMYPSPSPLATHTQDGNLDFRKKPFGNLKRPKEYEQFGTRCQCNINGLSYPPPPSLCLSLSLFTTSFFSFSSFSRVLILRSAFLSLPHHTHRKTNAHLTSLTRCHTPPSHTHAPTPPSHTCSDVKRVSSLQ